MADYNVQGQIHAVQPARTGQGKAQTVKEVEDEYKCYNQDFKAHSSCIGWTINSTFTYSSHVEPFFLSWLPSYLPAVDYIEYPSPIVMRNTAS